MSTIPLTEHQDEEPERASIDYDHHDPAHSQGEEGPYGTYGELRARCPVAWSQNWDGFWVVSDYRHVQEIALDDATWSSARGMGIPFIGNARPLLPIMTDPPEFWTYRRPLNPFFTRTAVARWEPRIRALANELIDGFIAEGRADLVRDYTQALPARITLRFLGLDEERWEEMVEWVQTGIHDSATDLDRSVEACMCIYAELATAIDERRDHGYRDDFISELLQLETETPAGQFLDEEVMDICALLMFGGLDTTTAATSNALYHLAADPEARHLLAAEPGRIPLAVEEFLRFEAPVQGLPRTATRDVELGGRKVLEGERVWLLWASANRDPARFERPDELVLDRHPNHHMTFGVGIHRCLGAHFGRAEFGIMLEEFLRRIPDYSLSGEAGVERYPDCSVVYGYRQLPVVFEPGVREGAE